MIKVKSHDIIFIVIIISISILVFFNIDQPFFWDKDILDSKQAHWFLENNFSLVLPDSIDPGHPPLMGFILAVLWSIFGKHLIVGHLFMWLVGIAVVVELKKLCDYYFNRPLAKFILLLIMVETALLTQIVVISSDLLLAFFFIFSINNILKNKSKILILSLIGLSLTNLRGMTTAFGLFLFNLYVNHHREEANRIAFHKLLYPYILASIPSIIFLTTHYFEKGWLVLNEKGPWAGCYENVGISGFIKNIIVYVWRMLDAGRIVIWGLVVFLIYHFWRNKIKLLTYTKQISVLLIIVIAISLPSALGSNMLIDNRYFLPIFISLSLLLGTLLEHSEQKLITKKNLLIIAIAASLSGSFWVYPDHISKCWSASLSHIPYYRLKKEMNEFINDNGIDKSKIGSYVPNVTQERYIELNESLFSYKQVDFENNKYIFYSNIYNISDEHLDELKNWSVLKRLDCCFVKVVLYEKR